MSNRSQRAQTAQQTLQILQSATYRTDQTDVSVRTELTAMIAGTRLYTPQDLEKLRASVANERQGAAVSQVTPMQATLSQTTPSQTTTFCVTNETTLSAARRQVTKTERLLCLNFASTKNPGGGFLGGSQAQEESLARASGLYASLQQQPEYYAVNRAESGHGLYSDHLIYSPAVPVFRDDDDQLLSAPYCVSMITSPAVNAGAVRKNAAHQVSAIEPTMKRRMRSVLAVALTHGYQHLVLGAWGCGVFRNNPLDVARWFADVLQDPHDFGDCFRQVDFAVLDHSDDQATFLAFEQQFAGPHGSSGLSENTVI